MKIEKIIFKEIIIYFFRRFGTKKKTTQMFSTLMKHAV